MCNGFVHIDIEVCLCCFYYADTLFAKYVHEFLVYELYSFGNGANVFGAFHVFQCSFHVVNDWQYGYDGFLATIEDEFCFLFDGALAVIVEFCYLAEQLVFEAGYFGVGSLELFFCGQLLFFFLRLLVGFRCRLGCFCS